MFIYIYIYFHSTFLSFLLIVLSLCGCVLFHALLLLVACCPAHFALAFVIPCDGVCTVCLFVFI